LTRRDSFSAFTHITICRCCRKVAGVEYAFWLYELTVHALTCGFIAIWIFAAQTATAGTRVAGKKTSLASFEIIGTTFNALRLYTSWCW